MKAYYNEFDPQAAAWLRELIKQGHIAPGDVDERSIEDVTPDELVGYNQCHFFAGIGVWSYALRLAGVSDSTEVWTGSCPCQPFSAAGKGKGFDDERHLWPAWQWLIQQRRPSRIYGEQVASKATEPWLDLVQADLEAMGYAFGCVPFPSASVGAPHIRDRAYWVGHASGQRLQKQQRIGGNVQEEAVPVQGETPERTGAPVGRVADTGLQQRQESTASGDEASGRKQEAAATTGLCGNSRTSPTNGFWRDADWLLCRDGKWRPVRPGSFPLVNGAAARVGHGSDFSLPTSEARVMRLRGYGNAINAIAAAEFIESCI